MGTSISKPIAIVDEHPEWSARLIAELQSRRLPFEKMHAREIVFSQNLIRDGFPVPSRRTVAALVEHLHPRPASGPWTGDCRGADVAEPAWVTPIVWGGSRCSRC